MSQPQSRPRTTLKLEPEAWPSSPPVPDFGTSRPAFLSTSMNFLAGVVSDGTAPVELRKLRLRDVDSVQSLVSSLASPPPASPPSAPDAGPQPAALAWSTISCPTRHLKRSRDLGEDRPLPGQTHQQAPYVPSHHHADPVVINQPPAVFAVPCHSGPAGAYLPMAPAPHPQSCAHGVPRPYYHAVPPQHPHVQSAPRVSAAHPIESHNQHSAAYSWQRPSHPSQLKHAYRGHPYHPHHHLYQQTQNQSTSMTPIPRSLSVSDGSVIVSRGPRASAASPNFLQRSPITRVKSSDSAPAPVPTTTTGPVRTAAEPAQPYQRKRQRSQSAPPPRDQTLELGHHHHLLEGPSHHHHHQQVDHETTEEELASFSSVSLSSPQSVDCCGTATSPPSSPSSSAAAGKRSDIYGLLN